MIHGMLQPMQKTVPQSYRCWHQQAVTVTGYQPNSNKGMKNNPDTYHEMYHHNIAKTST